MLLWYPHARMHCYAYVPLVTSYNASMEHWLTRVAVPRVFPCNNRPQDTSKGPFSFRLQRAKVSLCKYGPFFEIRELSKYPMSMFHSSYRLTLEWNTTFHMLLWPPHARMHCYAYVPLVTSYNSSVEHWLTHVAYPGWTD